MPHYLVKVYRHEAEGLQERDVVEFDRHWPATVLTITQPDGFADSKHEDQPVTFLHVKTHKDWAGYLYESAHMLCWNKNFGGAQILSISRM